MHVSMMVRGSSAQWVSAPKFGKRTGLPLLPFSKCGEEILELCCGEGSKVSGAIFFKCRLHGRDVLGSCPWYLFADKYEKILIAKGIIEKSGTAVASIRTEGWLPEVDQMRVAIGRIDGLVEANKTELAPWLDDAGSLKNGDVRVDKKLEKLIVIGEITAVCLVVVAIFVVVGVIIMVVQ